MAIALLFGVLVVALLSEDHRQLPASGPPFVAGGIPDAVRIFGENLLVLSLYAMCNIAAWLIQRLRTRETQSNVVNKEFLSRLATTLVIGLLLFAVCRQAYTLGHGLTGFSDYFYVNPWRLWLGVLPHALPELTGMLLPVAVLLFANSEGKENELLARTIAAVLIALPLLGTAALIEVYVSPKAFRVLTCIGESEGFHGGGDCKTEPQQCPKLSLTKFENRYHIHLSPAEVARAREHCST
jgi:hypothetical protein